MSLDDVTLAQRRKVYEHETSSPSRVMNYAKPMPITNKVGLTNPPRHEEGASDAT